MSEGNTFLNLVGAEVRAGDEEAARELVQRYGPRDPENSRVRLRDHCLRRAMDSMDICRWVFANFFVRAGARGQFDLKSEDAAPDEIAGGDGSQRVATNARRPGIVRRGTRDHRGHPAGQQTNARQGCGLSEPTISRQGSAQAVHNRLTDEERDLAEQVVRAARNGRRFRPLAHRRAGRTWQETGSSLTESCPGATRFMMQNCSRRAGRETGTC